MSRDRVWLSCGVSVAIVLAFVWAATSVENGSTTLPPPGSLESSPTAPVAPPSDSLDSPSSSARTPVELRVTVHAICADRGVPVPGALVQLVRRGRRFLATEDVMNVGLTDGNGAFSCPLHDIAARIGPGGLVPVDRLDFDMRVAAAGFAPENVPVPQGPASLVVRLKARTPMEVRFEDRQGRPVADVRVLVSASPFEPAAAAFRNRVPAAGGNSCLRAIVGGQSDASGSVRLEGLPDTEVHVYCEHVDHVAIDPIWSGGGLVGRTSSRHVVTMARLSIAAAILPSRRFLRCSFVSTPVTVAPREDVPRETVERVALQRRSISRRLETTGWHCVSVARVNGSLASESAASLHVTRCDGSEVVVSVPYRGVDELLRDGALRIDMPDLSGERIAYVDVNAVSSGGATLTALPYQLLRTADAKDSGEPVFATLRARTLEVAERTGRGPYPVLAGDYVAKLGANVGSSVEPVPVRCRVGQTTSVTLVVRDHVLPFRLRLIGDDASYVGWVTYGVRDSHDARIAGYAGSVDGTEPQVWLPRGNYSLDLRLVDARRRVPFAIDGGDEQGTVEVRLDPVR